MPGYIDTIKVDLGKLNLVNDAEVGSAVASAVQARFGGLLGCIVRLTHREAAQLSDTSIGTLYGGEYQYVKFSAAAAIGDFCMWDVAANNGITDYEVTATTTLAGEGFQAGFALRTMTSGNYGWIQRAGLASARCAASVTAATLGVQAVQVTTTATVDGIADATGSYIGGGALGLKNIVGTWYDAPANGALKRVVMKAFFLNL